MSVLKDRQSTHVYKVNKLSKEDMESMISRCVYEQPAYCVAACPLKLDTKEMLKHAAAGNFKKALQLYEKIAPFPLVLSAGCDAPCENKCKLCEAGDGVAIRGIERSVALYGEPTKASSVFRMKKKKTTVEAGSGLFCLLLAGELEKKAYPVTVICPEASAEEYLRAAGVPLSEAAFAAELKRLKGMDIDFRFGEEVTPELLRECLGQYDAVCGAFAPAEALAGGEEYNTALALFEKAALVTAPEGSVMNTALAAKRAALTVDRLVQKVDPRNLRGEEGAVETKLYTNLEDAAALKRVPMAGDVYTGEEAMAEAQRCMQCRCEECLRSCAYLQHYKKHPGLLAREIYNNTQIIMGDHPMNKPMNSCSLCGQCTVTCPNGFDMAQVCRMARTNMVSTDKMPLAAHEFALMDMLFSNNDAFLSRPQPGYTECKYVFFPGCQASAVAPETVRAAYEDLCRRLDGGVALMLGCCGAICDWAARDSLYEETKNLLDTELAKLGNPTVIAGCPTCAKELREHEGTEVTGIWDVLRSIGLPEGAKGLDRPAALHDSCGARGDAETQNAIRELAAALGCSLVDTPYSGDRSPCCGYGGLTAYTNREVARKMSQKCLERSEEPYISYCMACRDRFAREGRESHHILELVYGTDAGSPPDISEKRRNRLSLKENLLRELWGEEVKSMTPDYEIEFLPEALAMMDDRMLLRSDVISALDYIRETGEAIDDAESGLAIGRCRLGNITVWVKFTVDESGKYTVHGAYSHRMRIERRL